MKFLLLIWRSLKKPFASRRKKCKIERYYTTDMGQWHIEVKEKE